MAMFGSSWNDDSPEEGSMFGPKMGSWWVNSVSDPRWNSSGRGYGLVCCGDQYDAHTWIESCQEKYGDPPVDLEMGFM